jgi:hypothetical protein
MSRSYRKTPILGICGGGSEARDKKIWHSRWRSRERQQLAVLADAEAHLGVLRNEVSSTWDMTKDGKYWWGWKDQQAWFETYLPWRGQNEPPRKRIGRALAKLRGK